MHDGVRLISTPGSIQVESGSTIVTPDEHVPLVDPVAQGRRGRRELDPRVHSERVLRDRGVMWTATVSPSATSNATESVR